MYGPSRDAESRLQATRASFAAAHDYGTLESMLRVERLPSGIPSERRPGACPPDRYTARLIILGKNEPVQGERRPVARVSAGSEKRRSRHSADS